jgi:nicotinamide-nucleotide adenylyltransferase
MDRHSEIANLKRLFALYEAVETLDLTAPPTTCIVSPKGAPVPRRVGILCGSFNPLTLAHTELAKRALATFALDTVFFTLAKVTVDKEQVTGMSLEDRLLLLSLFAERHDQMGVALVNRGLYFEQAQAFRTLFGEETALYFLVGMDKLLQIFDPRYYQDRDAALHQLFAISSLIVANRGDMDEANFSQLLDRPENRRFRAHVHFFTLSAAVTNLSATALRNALAAEQPIDSQVPPETAAFLTETRAFAPPLQRGSESIDVYATRRALLSALYDARSWAEREVDFHRLMALALAPNETGRMLRQFGEGEDFIEQVSSSLTCERDR